MLSRKNRFSLPLFFLCACSAPGWQRVARSVEVSGHYGESEEEVFREEKPNGRDGQFWSVGVGVHPFAYFWPEEVRISNLPRLLPPDPVVEPQKDPHEQNPNPTEKPGDGKDSKDYLHFVSAWGTLEIGGTAAVGLAAVLLGVYFLWWKRRDRTKPKKASCSD